MKCRPRHDDWSVKATQERNKRECMQKRKKETTIMILSMIVVWCLTPSIVVASYYQHKKKMEKEKMKTDTANVFFSLTTIESKEIWPSISENWIV